MHAVMKDALLLVMTIPIPIPSSSSLRTDADADSRCSPGVSEHSTLLLSLP